MKTFIILILLVALGGALFITRPTQEDFGKYIHRKMAADSESTVQQLEAKFRADLYLEKCTHKNYFLWHNVYRDDKLIYVGVLSHWFAREAFPGSWEISKTPAAMR